MVDNEKSCFVDTNDPKFLASLQKWADAVGVLEREVAQAETYYQKLIAIKRFYKAYEKEMIAKPKQWQTVYPIDWSRLFTPIEFEAWLAIRRKGRIILYPQYPALNYHVDFGNPGLKIGLEIDGKQFHDTKRDIKRDTELKMAGWTIYRITGSEMVKADFKDLNDCRNDDMDEDDTLCHLRQWLFETGDGIIQAIKEVHFEDWSKIKDPPYVLMEYYNYCQLTLEEHRLV